MAATSTSTARIRTATPADRPALSKICLLTASAGHSAEPEHSIGGAFPGFVYAEPYAADGISSTWAVVLEDEGYGVVGYCVGTYDTRAFEASLEETWWPPLRTQYPLSLLSNPSNSDNNNETKLTEADARYIRKFHEPETAPEEVLRFARAHMHINLLDSHRRQGWGRKLIRAAAQLLKEAGHETLYLGIDPRNADARIFYVRIGFEKLDGPGAEWYGLKLDEFLQLGKDL